MGEKLLVKGHEIEVRVTKSGYDRKVVLFANNIIEDLKKLGISRDDIEIKTNVLGNQNVPAVIEFWTNGHYLRFSYAVTKRFVDNMYVISKLVHLEVNEVLSGEKELLKFYETFREDGSRKSKGKDLKAAKETLGVDEFEKDMEVINKAYKTLARKLHPDIGGDLDEFQKVNKAHKLIKKELGF